MFNKEHRKKYLRYTDSIDDDNNSDESENGRGNIDLIINKLEKNVNTGNINSGNADVILKITSQNQETTRTTKNNDSIINNISNFLPNNIKEKDSENSQDIGNSIISVNSIQKPVKISPKPLIDVDISLNNDLKEELENQENNGINKFILSTNNSNINNNLLLINKILNTNEKNNLSTLSTHLDNSRFFLNKKTNGLITTHKIEKDNKEKNNKEKEKDINLKLTINEKEEKDKDKNKDNKKEKKQIDKKVNKKYKRKYRYNSRSDWFNKRNCKRRCRNCNIITIIRDIFITIIVLSALAFYATIFIIG